MRYFGESFGHNNLLENVEIPDIAKKFVEWDLDDFENYNSRFDKGEFAGSEAIKYDIDKIKIWLSIRDKLTFTDNYNDGNWDYYLCITKMPTKYSTKYIFIDSVNHLWRIKETGSEFYEGPGKGCKPLNKII